MERRKSGKGFKLKGHTLPGVNQKIEGKNLPDGRHPSSAFQQNTVSPMKQDNDLSEYDAQGNFIGNVLPTASDELKDNRYIKSKGEFTSRPMSKGEQNQANYATMFTKGKCGSTEKSNC